MLGGALDVVEEKEGFSTGTTSGEVHASKRAIRPAPTEHCTKPKRRSYEYVYHTSVIGARKLELRQLRGSMSPWWKGGPVPTLRGLCLWLGGGLTQWWSSWR